MIKGAQSQIESFERNSRLRIIEPLPVMYASNEPNRPIFINSQIHTYTMFACQGRVANFTAKGIAAPRVSLSSFLLETTAPTAFLTGNHLFSFFFLLPLEIPTLDPFIFFPSAPLRTASPVSEPARTTLPISGYYYLTRNQGKSTEPTDKRRHESVTTRTRRYDTAATIENLRGGVSREGGGHVHPRDDDDGKSTSVETKARR